MLLFALLSSASSLVTRREAQKPVLVSRPACPNSDGLAGYNFSHKGNWFNGTLVGNGHSKATCAATCSNAPDCYGFSGEFSDYGKSGTCFLYTGLGSPTKSASERAFSKCTELVGLVPMTYPELIAMAEGMQGQLDKVKGVMSSAEGRMRTLKDMVTGSAVLLTDLSRKTSEIAGQALENRGGLLAIARSRKAINASFEAINSTQPRVEVALKKLEKRQGASKGANSTAGGAKGGNTTKGAGGSSADVLRKYAANVTKLEKTMTELTDPKVINAVDGLVASYNAFKGNVSAVVKRIVRKNLRGYVDVHRDALWNLTDAYNPEKKDPCCCD